MPYLLQNIILLTKISSYAELSVGYIMIILKTKQQRKWKTHAAMSYPCNIIHRKAKQYKTA
jgi:hypothetical protein